MDKRLKECEGLLLDNALLKVQNQTLANKNLKWKECQQAKQEIIKEQIQDNLEIVHADEEAYMNELVACQLQFDGYTYDRLPLPIPLVILEIGVGVKVTLINIITHVYEVFKTLNIVLNNTLVVETPRSQLVPLAKPIDTTSEQLVNDLIGSSR